ncbi:MAG TPA: adenylate/guanylate cyclase domain-containing protein [Actinomycetota bacterium]|nr:adenylate/guanylate cyclase domain-containing protein [Actinomycetota bacterium]
MVSTEVPEVRYAKTLDGGYIAHMLIGEGPMDIAIVGSIATNIELFFEFEPAARSWYELAAFSRLTVHDRRGTGLSDDMGGLPNLETRAADLLAVLDAAGQDRPTLLTSGDGGMVGALLAATHPDRVAGLVWFGAQARSVAAPDWPYGRDPADVERLASAAETGWGTEPFVRQMYAGAEMSEDVIRFLARMQRHACGPATAVRFIRLLHEYDVREILPALRLPVLALGTEGSPRDWIREQARATASLIPGADFHALPSSASRLWDEAVIAETLAFCGIERPPPELDTILTTVLFTDIVDSTEEQARLGDHGWKELVLRHHAVVREALARWRGAENDTAGDGFYATFDGPARAIRCALEVSERVRDLGIRVRAGVHTGECEVIEGKCGGLTVSIGARIAATAGPSDVIVSQTVKDLVAGSGLAFEDAGEHELKGVPDRWHLYRVVG